MTTEFREFAKIPRLFRDAVITEKLDGTNGCVLIEQWVNPPGNGEVEDKSLCIYSEKLDRFFSITAGSRKKWITPQEDNYGFARWVWEHALELVEGLGEGVHHGEWWGQGIQRGYGLKEKRFSLFNASKWNESNRPACCHVVPVLYSGPFNTEIASVQMGRLANIGSFAAPGYMNPEGIIVFHVAGNVLFKATIENDGIPKGSIK